MSKTPLKPEELKCITVHYAELVRHINVEDIIGYLVSKFVLTFDEKNEIQSKATRADKAECLLDKILKPGPDGRFQIFVDSLAQYNELHSNVTSYMDSLRNSQIETATNIASVCGAEGCGTPIA
uniref:CARD domain-containing protein n=1 Tax=Biomphalaria glabrata TaxID=6526 RepID=A0A2C9LJU2_BIOGL